MLGPGPGRTGDRDYAGEARFQARMSMESSAKRD